MDKRVKFAPINHLNRVDEYTCGSEYTLFILSKYYSVILEQNVPIVIFKLPVPIVYQYIIPECVMRLGRLFAIPNPNQLMDENITYISAKEQGIVPATISTSIQVRKGIMFTYMPRVV